MSTPGKKSTAEDALRGQSLKDKRVIVTGANSGLGEETARVLANAGADVVLAVRNVQSGEEVAKKLRASASATAAQLTVEKLDLTDLPSVRAFADAQKGKPLDLLINNAGIMATPFGKTVQGFEQQMGVNHLGHFLLTRLLLPLLRPGARVVNLSSGLHIQGTADGVLRTLDDDKAYEQRKYKPFKAYGDSKLANVLFARALAKRMPPGTETFSLHPGVINTNLSRSLGFQGVLFRFFGGPFLKSIPQGAATTVFAATAPELAGKSGEYLADCAVTKTSRFGRDEALAEKVWALSETAVAPFASA